MAHHQKISLLCHDLSINSVGRAQILASALSRAYQVEILGPASTGELWRPLRDELDVPYRILPSHPSPQLFGLIDGDVLLASKTRGASFGYALIAQMHRTRPLVLDIDDWDLAFFRDYPLRQKVADVVRFYDPDSILYTWGAEKLIGRATLTTVSNTFLQRKFGGVLVPHFRDTDALDPERFDPNALRHDLDLQDKKIVLFLGTPRRHKGLLELVAAVDQLDRADTVLLVVGATRADRALLPETPFLKVLGQQPFSQVPRYMAAADVVAISQANRPSSQGQLPAKLFDAMAMGRPIVATNVSDISEVLSDSGLVVDAGDISKLADAISHLLSRPDFAREMGLKARARCISRYSYDAIAPLLHDAVAEAVSRALQTATR